MHIAVAAFKHMYTLYIYIYIQRSPASGRPRDIFVISPCAHGIPAYIHMLIIKLAH